MPSLCFEITVPNLVGAILVSPDQIVAAIGSRGCEPALAGLDPAGNELWKKPYASALASTPFRVTGSTLVGLVLHHTSERLFLSLVDYQNGNECGWPVPFSYLTQATLFKSGIILLSGKRHLQWEDLLGSKCHAGLIDIGSGRVRLLQVAAAAHLPSGVDVWRTEEGIVVGHIHESGLFEAKGTLDLGPEPVVGFFEQRGVPWWYGPLGMGNVNDQAQSIRWEDAAYCEKWAAGPNVFAAGSTRSAILVFDFIKGSFQPINGGFSGDLASMDWCSQSGELFFLSAGVNRGRRDGVIRVWKWET